jgi:hypothetical protein
MKYIDICIVLLILLLCICFYKKEKYDTREGLFASLITQRQRSDGTKARQGVHFTGTKDPSGRIIIQPTDQGVIDTSQLKFLDTFYDGDDEFRILSYAKNPKSYPSKNVMNKLSEKSLQEIETELATAQQKATNAKKRVEDITNKLTMSRQNLVPINSENASNLEKIDQLKNQLSTAKQQAQEAEQKYQSELNKAKTATGVSVFTGMFEKVSAPPPAPAPAPVSNVTTNGRCGPTYGKNKICRPGECCSEGEWCGGNMFMNEGNYCRHTTPKDEWSPSLVTGWNKIVESSNWETSGTSPRTYRGAFDGKYDGERVPGYVVSTDGKCGETQRNTPVKNQKVICPTGQCCGQNYKCGGTKGTYDNNFCYNPEGNVGRWYGKYDGITPESKSTSSTSTISGWDGFESFIE